jgi:putative colanic acid biosysnthesis UDP-glucose lipid carrier transferase
MYASNTTGLNNINRSTKIAVGRDNLHQLTEALFGPLVLALTIWGVSYYYEGEVTTPSLIASLLAFSLTFPARSRLQEPVWHSVGDILLTWFMIATLILFFGYATRSLRLFSPDTIVNWLWIGPVTQVAGHLLFRAATPLIFKLQGKRRQAIIVGMNEQGLELAKRITSSPYNNIDLVGFFDDRTADRLPQAEKWSVIGDLSSLSKYAKERRVELIYLSLPMATQPRILNVLDDLRDTTASVYFVPDLFVTDLIQGRMDQVCSMPVVSVCETPFTGTNGLIKRGSDIVLSLLILLLISPLLAAIALAVKLTSPGPIIFKQRRYGLNGEDIVVYKFRSMTVCEDGGNIQQAQKNDKRVTRIGGFLRKSSLDELPQFVNVLQGRMSIVGPRPHAVAHNELYRKLIKGYMVRHKVKPGITGWAQVNGLRGETETLDKMQARIEYDLDYLRNWSLSLDLKIIFLTVAVVFKDQYAY